MSPMRSLYLLNKIEQAHGLLLKATQARESRQNFLATIKDSAESGKLALVWSGRDCDGVQYSGQVELVNANIAAVTKAVDHTYDWADGPCNFYIERPSVARRLTYDSRDLVMEAHEDGHPHVIYA